MLSSSSAGDPPQARSGAPRVYRPGRIGVALVLALGVLFGCDAPSPSARQSSTLSLRVRPDAERATPAGEALEFGRTFELQENRQVINVEPVVSLDPRGGFLVADVREAQLRRYSADGRLLWHAGKQGGGPGEFQAPTAVVRLRSGEILAADRMQRLTVFDSAGGAVLRTLSIPLGHVEDLGVVDDSLVLIAAVQTGNPMGPRLHLWNLVRNRSAASFFAPFASSPNRTAALVAGWSKFAVRGDTVAAIFATSDTAYFFTTTGAPLGAVRLPFLDFRHGARTLPRDGTDPRVRAQWLSSFDFVADVHWLPDGSLLVPFQNVSPERALERRWHLLRTTRTGERVWEVRDVPRLIDVAGEDGLYFVRPGAEAPNQWAVARLRG